MTPKKNCSTHTVVEIRRHPLWILYFPSFVSPLPTIFFCLFIPFSVTTSICRPQISLDHPNHPALQPLIARLEIRWKRDRGGFHPPNSNIKKCQFLAISTASPRQTMIITTRQPYYYKNDRMLDFMMVAANQIRNHTQKCFFLKIVQWLCVSDSYCSWSAIGSR